MDIGSKIKAIRKENKLTQAELSLKANISRSYLADIERNRYNPSVDTLRSLAESLGISLSELVDTNTNAKTIKQSKNYLIEQYLLSLGYEIIYDPEGNVILNTSDGQYEITELDIKDLQNNVDSFVKFKVHEIILKNKEMQNKSTTIPMAAHNDFARDSEQQKLMQQDLDEL